MKQLTHSLLLFFLLASSLFAEDYLFVIHAKQATYYPEKNRLMLQDIDTTVTYFSDDTKEAGKSDLKTFLASLTSEAKPYNTGFLYYSGGEDLYDDIAIVMRNPSFDLRARELSFEIKIISEGVQLPRKMKEINLFIDDVPGEFIDAE